MQRRSNVSRLVIAIALLLLGSPHSTTTAATAASAATTSVAVTNFQFTPQTISIKVGDQVTWTNAVNFQHNVFADDGSFTSGALATSFVYTHQFNTPGVYRYYCQQHGGPDGLGMSGTVTVTSATVLTPTVYLPGITR